MNLSKEAIEEFIGIYRTEFGYTLAQQEAEEMATDLLNLYNLISK
jgi:hypothetical protein